MSNFRRLAWAAYEGNVFPVPERARETLVGFLTGMVEEGFAPITIRNYLATASHYFAAAGAPEVTAGLKPPIRVRKRLTQALLPGETERLLEAFDRKSAHAEVLTRVLLLTGLRLSEFLALGCSDKDLKAQRLAVKMPNGLSRPVYIGAQAARLIRRLYRPRRKFSRGESGRSAYTALLKRAAEKAGVENVTPSRLRMTYAVRMLAAGHDFEFIAKNLGFDLASSESRRRLKDVFTLYLSALHEETEHDD